MATATNQIVSKNTAHAFIYAGGQIFDSQRYFDVGQGVALQNALDVARHRYGHALCRCRKPYLRLQIRKLEDKYILAVWPDEGLKHDSSCIFFREERQSLKEFASCISPVMEASGNQSAEAAPKLKLNLSFAFGVSQGQVATHKAAIDGPKVSRESNGKSPPSIGLRGLTNILWEEASLNRWHPSWNRDWGRARFEIVKAASNMIVRGEPLAHRMYIPRVYRPDKKGQLNAELQQFISGLAKNSDESMRSGLLIAPARKLVNLPDGGHSLHLRNMVPPVGLSQGTIDFLEKECELACTRLEQMSLPEVDAAERRGLLQTELADLKPEVIAVLHVRANSRGGLMCLGAWLMLTHPTTFIPTANPYEMRLVQSLLEKGHQFSRILSTERTVLRSHFDWVIRHVFGPDGKVVSKACLDIIGSSRAPNYVSRRHVLAQRHGNKGVPVWIWRPIDGRIGELVPELPPKDDVIGNQISLALLNIKAYRNVSYQFGPPNVQAQ